MRGQLLGVELDVVAWTTPPIAAAAQEVVHLEGFVRGDVELRQRELDKARLRGPEIEVHRNEYRIGFVPFAVNQELRVVDGMEVQAPVALQRRVVVADAVQARDQLAQAVGSI